MSQDRQTQLEETVKEHGSQLAALTTSQALTAQTVTRIDAQLTKLDLIQKVASDVEHIRELSQTRITTVEERVHRVENKVFNESAN